MRLLARRLHYKNSVNGKMLIPIVATFEPVAVAVPVAVKPAPVAAAIPVSTAIPVAVKPTAVAAATAATVESAATAAAVEPAAATVESTAAASAFPGLSLFYYDRVTIQFCFIQSVDGSFCLIVVRHFNKRKATGTASLVVSDDFTGIHNAIGFKRRAQIVAVSLEIQLCYKNVHYKKN